VLGDPPHEVGVGDAAPARKGLLGGGGKGPQGLGRLGQGLQRSLPAPGDAGGLEVGDRQGEARDGQGEGDARPHLVAVGHEAGFVVCAEEERTVYGPNLAKGLPPHPGGPDLFKGEAQAQGPRQQALDHREAVALGLQLHREHGAVAGDAVEPVCVAHQPPGALLRDGRALHLHLHPLADDGFGGAWQREEGGLRGRHGGAPRR
jgi:hypothetical protein